MWRTVKYASGAVLGCVLGLGASLNLQDTSREAIVLMPSLGATAQVELLFRLSVTKAHAAGTKRSRRRDRHDAEERKAEEQRLKDEAEQKFKGVRRTTLPTDCVYDSNASAFNSAELYNCDGMYYQRYEENGKTYYEGHPVGLDRGELQEERLRQIEAAKKRREQAKKNLDARRRPTLPDDCGYDSYASASAGTDIYVCRGVRYRQYQENGVTGYEVVKP